MSSRTGRPKLENARDKKLNIRLRQEELDLIQECSEKLKKTRTDTIMEGIKKLKRELDK
ncbi:CopG family transcriptional regulator [Fusobacterium necrophorum]|uniref:CopG family transcriptional regulator n=1 Tax=Fusobacterium necrophorum TaxID=859 RepID=UPI000C1FAC60|nr:CopG family transcriptional regulator [Fusobacterium necrophorum]KAB0553157.1 CopG family transcriptional regulator [Fusobacterium necrophorum subsp. funduliforme]